MKYQVKAAGGRLEIPEKAKHTILARVRASDHLIEIGTAGKTAVEWAGTDC